MVLSVLRQQQVQVTMMQHQTIVQDQLHIHVINKYVQQRLYSHVRMVYVVTIQKQVVKQLRKHVIDKKTI